MAKFAIGKNNKEEDIAEESNPAPEYFRWVLGTFIDPLSLEWNFVQAKFDIVNKTMYDIKTERAGGDWEVMRERLQVMQVQMGFFEKENNKENK